MEPSDVPDENATILHVGNLDRRVTDAMMINILKNGLPLMEDRVLSATMYQGDMINPDGYCFVQFQDNNAACQAMSFLNGRDFCGKKVKVSWATNNANGGLPKVIGTSVAIYVGNLDEEITEEDLKVAFEIFGEILNVKIVRDPITNKSKNIGFISFSNKPDAEKAIREMHGAMLKTRPIKTNWATRNQNQKREEHDYDDVFKAANEENCTIYVGGIPTNANDNMVRNHFDGHGKIMDLRIFNAKNYAFIRFDTHGGATTAICKTNGSEINGSCLKVWWGKETSDGGGGGGGSRHYNNQSSHHQNSNNPQNPYLNMTPQQQQQYMQYMYNNPYYQQQYYQYWMQQYQSQMQQNPAAAAQMYGGYQYPGGYGQQPGAQPQQNQQQPPQGGGFPQ